MSSEQMRNKVYDKPETTAMKENRNPSREGSHLLCVLHGDASVTTFSLSLLRSWKLSSNWLNPGGVTSHSRRERHDHRGSVTLESRLITTPRAAPCNGIFLMMSFDSALNQDPLIATLSCVLVGSK